MKKAWAIAMTSVRRLTRERSNIFFIFLMPMMLILIFGTAFGGEYVPRVGIVHVDTGPLGQDLYERISSLDGVLASEWEDEDDLLLAVERGELEAGVIIPAGYDDSLRAGEKVTVEFVGRTSTSAEALKNTIRAVVEEQGSLLRAARFAESQGVSDFSQALADAEEVAAKTEGLTIEQDTIGESFALEGAGRFELGAYSQLLLFIFLTSMSGSAALIQSRQLGVSRRMLSTPTSIRTILTGEALGRLFVALVQGLIIIVGSSVAFGVDWGDPLGAAAIFLLFSMVAAGSGMLMGSIFKNDQQAAGLGVIVGLGMAALGGCMIPLVIMEIFSPTLYKIAHITPHAWAVEAFEELVLHGGAIADIWLQLAVLSAFAVVVYMLAVWRLRIALTRG